MDLQGTSSTNVQSVFISTASRMDRCIPFHSYQYGRAGCFPFHHQQYAWAGCIHFHSHQFGHTLCRVYPFPPLAVWMCRVYPLSPPAVWMFIVCPFLPPAVWMCRMYPFLKCRNVWLSGIRSVWYLNEQKCWCRNQFGTGRGPSVVPECSGTGVRYRMLECQCRQHRPRCQCPAMVKPYFSRIVKISVCCASSVYSKRMVTNC